MPENDDLLEQCKTLLEESELKHGKDYSGCYLDHMNGEYLLEIEDHSGIRPIIVIHAYCPATLLKELSTELRRVKEETTGKLNMKKFVAFI